MNGVRRTGILRDSMRSGTEPRVPDAWATKCRSEAVSRILSPRTRYARARGVTTIPLALPSLAGSSDLPGGFGRAILKRLPIWSCSVRGLACHSPCGERGALLPHLFTLTPNGAEAPSQGGMFSVPLSFESPRPGVSRRTALWSSDFPPGANRPKSRLRARRSSGPLRRTHGERPRRHWRGHRSTTTSHPSLDGWHTARASCRDCYAACRSPRPFSRCSTRARAASRQGSVVRLLP